jgi:hypothetical protein
MIKILLRIGRAGAAANSARPRESGDPESQRDSSALILRSPRSGRLEGEGGLNPSRRALWVLLRMRPNTCNVDARDERGHDASDGMGFAALNPSNALREGRRGEGEEERAARRMPAGNRDQESRGGVLRATSIRPMAATTMPSSPGSTASVNMLTPRDIIMTPRKHKAAHRRPTTMSAMPRILMTKGSAALGLQRPRRCGPVL